MMETTIEIEGCDEIGWDKISIDFDIDFRRDAVTSNSRFRTVRGGRA